MTSVLKTIVEDAKFLHELVTDLEWSGERQGPGSYQGANDGTLFRACPLCGGLPLDEKSARYSFNKSAFGHRSGCRIAKALNRPTHLDDNETGKPHAMKYRIHYELADGTKDHIDIEGESAEEIREKADLELFKRGKIIDRWSEKL